jgi:ABC-2 type transport system permease protein
MCESAQDSQPFQMILSVSWLPIFVVMGSVIANPESNLFGIITWVPFYTPFCMMARIGLPVPMWEIGATSLLTVLFIAWEVRFMGRLFRATLMRTGQPPKWREVWRLAGSQS